jgi:nucleotide-binding universal stress UspA family protein
VDLIAIGAGYEKKFGEFNLGETIPYVLKNAPCRVLICREPIPEEER